MRSTKELSRASRLKLLGATATRTSTRTLAVVATGSSRRHDWVSSSSRPGPVHTAVPSSAAALTARRWQTTSPRARYEQLVASGEISRDPNQEKVADLLDELARKVTPYTPSGRPQITQARTPPPQPQQSGGGGFFGGLFGGGSKPSAPAKPVEPPRMVPSGPRGLYVWGGTGSGKTFLMDIFYDTVPVQSKKRIHFHEWMIDVHERLHRLQKKNAMVQEKANTVWTAEAALAQQKELKKGAPVQSDSADDLIAQVAREMMNEAWLLCFDEFQVTHISDAIIMRRLFSILFQSGAVVVATSNRPPEDLYLNGLNRPLFLPFIPMLKDFCQVHDIASGVDYRFLAVGEEEDSRVYITPNGTEEKKLLDRKFHRLCRGGTVAGGQVEAQGRRIAVPKAAQNSNVAWFQFKDLCDKPLGAADYLAIGSAFHTIFLADIPKLTMQERDQVRRFITLIDAFYERHTKLVCTADLDPIKLFHVTDEERKSSIADEIFAWDRTVSRLLEMSSAKYLSEVARRIDGEQFLGQFDLHSLGNDELQEMWRRYDADDNGELDPEEVRLLLEDILEVHQGHRCLSDEVFDICMETIDLDKNGSVSFEEMQSYLTNFSTVTNQMSL